MARIDQLLAITYGNADGDRDRRRLINNDNSGDCLRMSMPLILVHEAVAHGPGLKIADEIMISLVSTTSSAST